MASWILNLQPTLKQKQNESESPLILSTCLEHPAQRKVPRDIQLSTWLNILVLVAETGQKGRDQICLPSTVYLLIDMLPTPRGVISTIMVSN